MNLNTPTILKKNIPFHSKYFSIFNAEKYLSLRIH